MEGMPSVEHVIVVDRGGTNPPMTEGRDHFWSELVDGADAECEPEPMDAEDPLFILYTSGSTGKPKGIQHSTAGYLTHVSATHRMVFDLKDETDVYWCGADIGWITGHSLHRLRPARQRCDLGHVRGCAELPEGRPLVGDHRALQGLDLLHGADRYPRLHEVGRRAPAGPRSELAAAAGIGRRADQPARLALVPREHRRRALPDRRHLVADGDGRDHDLAAARVDDDEAGIGDDAAARRYAPRSSTRTATRSRRAAARWC